MDGQLSKGRRTSGAGRKGRDGVTGLHRGTERGLPVFVTVYHQLPYANCNGFLQGFSMLDLVVRFLINTRQTAGRLSLLSLTAV